MFAYQAAVREMRKKDAGEPCDEDAWGGRWRARSRPRLIMSYSMMKESGAGHTSLILEDSRLPVAL